MHVCILTVVPAGMINACDREGNSALLRCAMQDSRDTVRKLLASKAAIERHLLDLSIQNNYGRTVLHYLVINRDKHNIRLFLNILGRLMKCSLFHCILNIYNFQRMPGTP